MPLRLKTARLWIAVVLGVGVALAVVTGTSDNADRRGLGHPGLTSAL